MPIYQYTCEKCGHTFESVRKMGEGNAVLRCPRCGRQSARMVFSTFHSPAFGGNCAPAGGG